jgi:hypothetical protein
MRHFISWLQSVLRVTAPMVRLRLRGVGALIAPQASPHRIYGEQYGSDSPTGFHHSILLFPCQYHSTTVSIIPLLSVSFHHFQYHSTTASIIAPLPVLFRHCQYHSATASIIPPLPVSFCHCQYHSATVSIIPPLPQFHIHSRPIDAA